MPTYDLILSLDEQQNVAFIAPVANRSWPLKFRCLQCNDVSKNFIFVDPREQVDTDGGGVRNCLFKCAFCKSTITVDVLPDVIALDVAKAENSGKGLEGAIVSFEVRGGEPEALRLDSQWKVESAGGATFDDVDLSTDWVEYDEDAGVPVSLSGAAATFAKAKAKKK